MIRTFASSISAQAAYTLVQDLQEYFVTQLNGISQTWGSNTPFEAIEWFRDEGKHGGGLRYEARDETVFNRASVNISQIHYDDIAQKALASASAISTIIHPNNPHAPSMHMHISWTELKNSKGYWRIMADLNPSIENSEDRSSFTANLKAMAPACSSEALAQGERYFFIPALERHRGVSHFYLENFNSQDSEADKILAKECGQSVIDTYIAILNKNLAKTVTPQDKEAQLAYHTLYLFQVLTLDRGTTSGLLVHDQNDVGILGSLPSQVDKSLLQKWLSKMPSPQDKLLQSIIDILPDSSIMIDQKIKKSLAEAVRVHYEHYPEALSLQASGNIIPPTVQNHR